MASLEHLPAAYTCMAQDGPRLGSLEANAETAFGVRSVYEMSTSVKERSGGQVWDHQAPRTGMRW